MRFEDVIEKTKEVSLTAEEKTEIRNKLRAFIIANPPKASFWARFSALPYFRLASGVLVLILSTAGISLAAEKALPGDALYPLKVKVSEEVASFLLFSEEAKAEWEVARAIRRLEEVEELTTQGVIDEEKRAIIEENFAAHAARVEERIASFEAKKNFSAAADLSSNFETSLRAHEEILNRFEEENIKELEEFRPLVKKVSSTAEAAAQARKNIEDRISEEEKDEDDSEPDRNRGKNKGKGRN